MFSFASFSINHPWFEHQICRTRRYTNVLGCEVNILHSELFPGSTTVLVLSGANANGYPMRCFFPFFSWTSTVCVAP